ncbi:MAG: hypothetical protein VKO64_07400 [Candidatus Sericytochromatia bacterium]|nr:hypothetical protein [Candidatus Sericytochromatia bacterium]
MRLSKLLMLGVICAGMTGCTSIRYALEDSDVPVSLSRPAMTGKVTTENRHYFGAAALLTWNDFIGSLSQPIPAAVARTTRKSEGTKGIRVTAIQEEWSPTDIGINFLVGAASPLTGGLSQALLTLTTTTNTEANK